MTGWGELACLLIDSECDHSVSVLIGGQQEIPCWVESKPARELSLSGFMVYIGEFARILVDLEDHNAVMTAIGAVEKSP